MQPKWVVTEDEFSVMVNVIAKLDPSVYVEARIRAVVEKCAAMHDEAGDGRLPVELRGG